ncbi:hypothetical protein [Agrobacterium tumefaciens]|uniref:hypothetical protein n=1 Tax=Agrobacterium tumefaciens TaxID=358 RepID=UPI001658DA53|nr:hypothetical protein [Agrobacterium tumefaciens]QNP81965.1 hypothetical protein IAI05_18570 [Agrobacterium tumefaciens]
MTRDKKLSTVERYQPPQLSVDDPEQSVSLSFLSAWCRATSSAMAAAIINRGRTQSVTIEALEKIKLRDGDAFRSGDDWVTLSSHACHGKAEMRVQQWLSSELLVFLTRLSPGAGFHAEVSRCS